MGAALEEARAALEEGEIPVGAVITLGGKIIARAHNRPVGLSDPTAHAEILTIREAARKTGNYRLDGASLFVTLEPCPMCFGAIVHARIARLYYGAADPKTGAVESQWHMARHPGLNHRVEVFPGSFSEPCREILQGFFHLKRLHFHKATSGEIPKWS